MSEINQTAEEERAFNAMLDEAFGGSQPPDLSSQILARFYNSTTHADSDNYSGSVAYSGSKVQQAKKRKAARGHRSRSMQLKVVAGTITAIAAVVTVVVTLQPDHDITDSVTELVENAQHDEDGEEVSSVVDSNRDRQVPKAKKNPSRKPPKGIPMIVQTPDLEGANSVLEPGDPPNSPNAEEYEVAELALVSAQVDAEMRGYWEAIGIDPTSDATVEETVARLANALGMKVSVNAVSNVEQLEVELAQSGNAKAIAKRWLGQITGQRSDRIDATVRDQLVDEMAGAIRTGSSFDKTVAGWLNGNSKNSGAFFSALAAGPRSGGGEHGIARSLAALTLNVDARCTRCHDAYIEGNGRQSEYWDFFAFLKRGVQKDAEGKFKVDVDSGNTTTDAVFYELSDGRQRVADARVPASWTSESASGRYRKMKEFAKGLEGSPELASGIVNSLWQLVHGQPLRGRVVDPISAPHNEALQRLEEQLTDDLIDSRFNVARTLALIVASPAMRRAVPETLLPNNLWLAKQEETSAAMSAVDAFAAALPPRVSLPAAQRADQVLRSIGARIDSNPIESLGQIGEGGNRTKFKGEKPLAVDFPVKAEFLPVQWLELIKDQKSQINHLGYLAGQNEVPTHVRESVEAMQDAEVDSNLLLHRVWWLMKP